MHFQFEISSAVPRAVTTITPPAADPPGTAELLQQLLDVQRDQLHLMRSATAAQDHGSRWRAFLNRWQDDFPEVGGTCRQVLPALERAYITMIAELGEHLRQQGDEALENDFELGEFLDRFGMRLGQLGTILSLVGPLAEAAATQNESS